jgi:hypothetical protein
LTAEFAGIGVRRLTAESAAIEAKGAAFGASVAAASRTKFHREKCTRTGTHRSAAPPSARCRGDQSPVTLNSALRRRHCRPLVSVAVSSNHKLPSSSALLVLLGSFSGARFRAPDAVYGFGDPIDKRDPEWTDMLRKGDDAAKCVAEQFANRRGSSR